MRRPWSPNCSAAHADDGASIADLARWLTSQGAPTRTGKTHWDRSVVWGMLRNPAYAGRAVFGKTQVLQEQPALNRRARLEGRTTPRASRTMAAANNGSRSPSPRSSAPRRSSAPPGALRTTSGSLPATARSRPCSRAWQPARPADMATTAPRPAPPVRRSTITGASALMTTATKAGGSAATSRSALTTSIPRTPRTRQQEAAAQSQTIIVSTSWP